MSLSPYPEVNALIDEIQARLRATLGRNLVGVYVSGSLAMGNFEIETSDIDLAAALSDDLTAEEFELLDELHPEVVGAHPRWENRVEVAYISCNKLKRIRPDDRIALISPGEPFHFKEAGNDWLLNLHLLREHGLTVFGPPPQTLIDPVSNDDITAMVRRLMREWREWITQTDLIHRRKYQGHMIITMCRNLYLFRNNTVASKREAAAWAAQLLPEWSSLIRDALVWREADDDDAIDQDAMLPETLRFVHVVIDTILDERANAFTP